MIHDPDISPAQLEELALQEELDKLLARESFLAFYQRMTGFKPPRHFKVITKLLEAMEHDRIDRAMLFAPPRHIKTLGATILFPAWIMGRYPSAKIMSVVHTAHYAAKVGRNVRNLLRNPAWPFDDVELADDSQAKEQWATTAGGEYNGFGAIGGNQHGNPAEWLFMDDLVKGRKIAMSPHMREEIWETYKADLLSRLQGRRKQLMVFTRWHMDDPAGRILPEDFDGKTGWYKDRETGEKWYVLSLPAIAEHDNDPLGRKAGEWLWPEQFGEKQLGGVRKRGGWMWSALFQQRPSPEEGLLFTEEHFQRYDPGRLDLTRLQIYGASDYATKEKETQVDDPDWTVHTVWGVDSDWNIYLLDGWRDRTEPDLWIKAWVALVKKWKPLMWGEEQGQIIRSVGPFLRVIARDQQAFTMRRQLTSSLDKVQRAQSLLGIASMGKLFLPARDKCGKRMLAFLDVFEKEMKQFPTGRKDDTVDAATLFARLLDQVIAGQAPKKARSPHGDTLDDLWSRHEQQMNQRRQFP